MVLTLTRRRWAWLSWWSNPDGWLLPSSRHNYIKWRLLTGEPGENMAVKWRAQLTSQQMVLSLHSCLSSCQANKQYPIIFSPHGWVITTNCVPLTRKPDVGWLSTQDFRLCGNKQREGGGIVETQKTLNQCGFLNTAYHHVRLTGSVLHVRRYIQTRCHTCTDLPSKWHGNRVLCNSWPVHSSTGRTWKKIGWLDNKIINKHP